MVVLISAISFLGYIIIQVAGEKRGVMLTAINGGLISSTAVTVSMGCFAKGHKDNFLFSSGVLLASAIMFGRVIIEVLVVHPEILRLLWIPLATMFSGLILLFAWYWRLKCQEETDEQQNIEFKNPLQIGMALKFGLLLTAILFMSEAMQEWFSSYGIYALPVASGLIDVDAIALTLSRFAKQDLALEVATLGILLACLTNTLVKGLLFAFIAGFKDNFKLPLLMLVALMPGILVAIFPPG